MGENLYDLKLGKDFLNMMSKGEPQEKTMINKTIKIKILLFNISTHLPFSHTAGSGALLMGKNCYGSPVQLAAAFFSLYINKTDILAHMSVS